MRVNIDYLIFEVFVEPLLCLRGVSVHFVFKTDLLKVLVCLALSLSLSSVCWQHHVLVLIEVLPKVRNSLIILCLQTIRLCLLKLSSLLVNAFRRWQFYLDFTCALLVLIFSANARFKVFVCFKDEHWLLQSVVFNPNLR